jgi:hypothetical protein
MTRKRRQHGHEKKREASAQRAKLDALARGVGVDPTALTPHNSYDQPDFVERGYYVDKPFVCEACGIAQTWTAAQQKWWYEVAKGNVFSTAKNCRVCRQRERSQDGDPKPYMNPGLVLRKIGSEIESKLRSAGYRPIYRNRNHSRHVMFIEYSRLDDVFTISWNQRYARLAAEFTAGAAEPRDVATAELSGARSSADIDVRLGPFMSVVRGFLDGLKRSGQNL